MISDALFRRVRRDGARPFLTYYDLRTGARTELSGVTFANWVDKTCHLYAELGVEPGDVVALPIALTDPGHWVTLALTMAAWQAGATVTPADAGDALVTAVGPSDPRVDVGGAFGGTGVLLASSLHPLGAGFERQLPPDVVDFSVDVRSQPDQHIEAEPDPSDLAWVDSARRLTYGDLARAVESSHDRGVLVPTTPYDTVLAALVSPLLGGGSTVVVVGPAHADHLARIAESEKAVRLQAEV